MGDEGFIGNKYVVDAESIKTGKDTWDVLEVSVSKVANGMKEKVGRYRRGYSSLYNTFFPFVHNGKEYALFSDDYTKTSVMELPSCTKIATEETRYFQWDDAAKPKFKPIDITEEEYTRLTAEDEAKGIEYKDRRGHAYEGFCPVDFYVPVYRKVTFPESLGKTGKPLEGWLTGDKCFDVKNDKSVPGPIQYCDFGFVAGCIWGDDSSWKIEFLDLSQVEKGIIRRDDRFGYIELPAKMNLKEAIDMSTWEPNHPWLGVTHTTRWNYVTKESE